jgi:hypothetical protein
MKSQMYEALWALNRRFDDGILQLSHGPAVKPEELSFLLADW